MDHKEQHHQHHQKEREEKKKEQKEYEHMVEKHLQGNGGTSKGKIVQAPWAGWTGPFQGIRVRQDMP